MKASPQKLISKKRKGVGKKRVEIACSARGRKRKAGEESI